MNDWSTDDRAERTWQALVGMYGSRLIKKFDEEPPEIWRAAIRRLDDKQLQRGLAALGNEGGDDPPSLPHFIQACKTITPSEAASLAPRLEPPRYDAFHREGQLVLLAFIRQRGGVSEEALKALIRVKNTLVEHCRLLDEDGDPEGARLPYHLRKRLAETLAKFEGQHAA